MSLVTLITATSALARRIDHTELAMVLGMAEACRRAGIEDVRVWPVDGTSAVLCEAGSPFNKVIGLGFGDQPDERAWEEIERAHRERGVRVQVELATLADPRVATSLTARGYRLVGFENVLARRLDDRVEAAPGDGVPVSVVGAAELPAWTEAVITGFLCPDRPDGPPAHEVFDREALERTYVRVGDLAGIVRHLARLDGVAAGGASLYVREGIALFCGAATLPAYRRRGVQGALLRARIGHARNAGCDLAVVTTEPGSKSQQNVQRAGFELVYSRAILVLEA
jgi:GNAT superfamily N-acetyltransferase